PAGLSKGVLVYAFGRQIPRLVQTSVALLVRLPVFRVIVAERRPQIEPVCGPDVWNMIVDRLRQRRRDSSGEWLHFQSQWDKQRSSVIGLSASGQPEFFL